MAHELGISKKTLIGIEKGRSSLGWTGSAALCLLFGDSPTLRRELSGDPMRTAAELRGHTPPEPPAPTPAKGENNFAFPAPAPDGAPAAEAPPASSPLWRTVARLGRFTAEQNMISEHYRLLDPSGRRVFASFDYPEVAAEAAPDPIPRPTRTPLSAVLPRAGATLRQTLQNLQTALKQQSLLTATPQFP